MKKQQKPKLITFKKGTKVFNGHTKETCNAWYLIINGKRISDTFVVEFINGAITIPFYVIIVENKFGMGFRFSQVDHAKKYLVGYLNGIYKNTNECPKEFELY